MTFGHFIWNDLSTYDVDKARADYSALFGWNFHSDAEYEYACLAEQQTVAIFPMPQRFVDMDMPSFWMSYIRVETLERSVEIATSHDDAILEVGPHAFDEHAQIALVRDPSGAGFTLYEGPEISRVTNSNGSVCQIYHHCADVGLIRSFYDELFGWQFHQTANGPWPVFDIVDDKGNPVATAEEVPPEIRGKFSYWMPSFGTAANENLAEKVGSESFEIFAELGDDRYLGSDRQGAHFMVQNPDA